MENDEFRDQLRLTQRREAFLQALCPWGWQDVDLTVQYLDEAGIEDEEFLESVDEYVADTGCFLKDVDPVARAVDYICERVPGAETLADYTSANFICTTIDLDPEDAGKILSQVRPEDRESKAFQFLVRFCDAAAYVQPWKEEISSCAITL